MEQQTEFIISKVSWKLRALAGLLHDEEGRTRTYDTETLAGLSVLLKDLAEDLQSVVS